jgi:hypothetical protein
VRLTRCDVRGPHRLTQKRPPTLASILQSLAAAEIINIRHSRDFRSPSIFDFFNTIGKADVEMRMLDLAGSRGLDLAQGRGHSEGSAVTPQFICSLYSITTKQAAIAALFRVVNRYVGNLPPMPGIFPDYPAPVVRNSGGEREMTMMRWGHAATTAHWWATGHEHPQHVLAALARLAQAGKSLSCSAQQLRGIRARAEPRGQKGRHRLVRAR